MTAKTFSDADILYLRRNYLTLDELCADRPEAPEHVETLIEQGVLPRPSYVLADGTGVSSVCELLVLARPRSRDWREALREQVDELDALERDFAPDHDRGDDQDRPPTRDLLIKAAPERHAGVFDGAAGQTEAA